MPSHPSYTWDDVWSKKSGGVELNYITQLLHLHQEYNEENYLYPDEILIWNKKSGLMDPPLHSLWLPEAYRTLFLSLIIIEKTEIFALREKKSGIWK